MYKSKILTLVTMSIVDVPKWPFLLMYISCNVDDWERWFLGRAHRTRETLPDFREWCRVT